MSDVILHILRKLNYNVIGVAPTDVLALKMIEEFKPQLILMDILIEGKKDGIDIANIAKKKYDIPVIFITALSHIEYMERAKEAEPYGYLVKPFNLRDLIGTIEIALKKMEIEIKSKESQL